MGTRRYKKISNGCEIDIKKKKGRIFFKCKNLKRSPSAQEIIESLNKSGGKNEKKL